MNLSRLRSTLGFLCALLCLLVGGNAANAQIVYDSYPGGLKAQSNDIHASNNDFDGTKTLSAAGFTDEAGSAYNISGGVVVGSTAGGSDFGTKQLIRTSAEDNPNGTAVAYIGHSSVSAAVITRFSRTTANTFYMGSLVPVSSSVAQIDVYKVLSGSATPIAASANFAYNPAHDYRIDEWTRPDATAGTDISTTISDLTTQTVLGRCDIVGDTTAGLQSAGGFGVTGWGGNVTVNRYETFSGASPPISGTKLGKLVLCIGNSITYGYQVASPFQITQPYPVQLQTLLGSGYHVINLGFDGQDSDSIFGFQSAPNTGISSPFIDFNPPGLTAEIYPCIDKLDYSEVDAVYMEGTNQQNSEALGGDTQTVSDMFLRMQQAGVQLKAAGVDKFYLCTFIATVNPTGSSESDSAYAAQRDAVNGLIRSNASSFDGVIDVANALTGGTAVFALQSGITNTGIYAADETHPINAGATVIANTVYSAFVSHVFRLRSGSRSRMANSSPN